MHIVDRKYFDSFYDATNYFNLTGHVIKIIHDPYSLEKVLYSGNVVKCIGIGSRISPGRPGGNQQIELQSPIFSELSKHPYLIPIFYKRSKVEYLGMYKLKDFKKITSYTGFRYFEFTFTRESKHYLLEYE